MHDYIRFAAVLNEIGKIAEIHFAKDLFDFNDGEMVEQLKGIRIHDYYLKKKFMLIADELYKQLVSISGGTFSVIREDRNLERNGRNAAVNTIFINHGMTRAQGLVEMMYVVKKGLCLGVQIQANSYRKFVVGNNSKTIAEELKKNNAWFNLPVNFGSDLQEYPKKIEKEFNCYNGEFYYRYITIPNTAKISDAVDCMLQDAKTISKLVADGVIDR